jgi:S-adenosylmethionine uptake transporter
MLGTAILIAPNVSTGNVWGLWALASSVFSAGAHIALRALKDERSEAVVFWLQIAVFLLSLILVIFTQGVVTVPSSRIWLALAGVGVFATAGQLLMTKAYALETAGRVAAVRFVGPIWGIALDVLFFTGWPESHVWVGGVVIVSAGLMATMKGRQKA